MRLPQMIALPRLSVLHWGAEFHLSALGRLDQANDEAYLPGFQTASA